MAAATAGSVESATISTGARSPPEPVVALITRLVS
jgi:hypothetical protein